MLLPSLFLPPGVRPSREAYIAQAVIEGARESDLSEFSVDELAQQMALIDLATWTEILRRRDEQARVTAMLDLNQRWRS